MTPTLTCPTCQREFPETWNTFADGPEPERAPCCSAYKAQIDERNRERSAEAAVERERNGVDPYFSPEAILARYEAARRKSRGGKAVSGDQGDAPAPAAAVGPLTLPPEFWAARESLRRIQQAAHNRVRSADVVFLSTLARVSAMAPHKLRADTGIGKPASLNVFVAIVGPSGAGKSSGNAVSRDVVKGADAVEELPLGSGEGLAEAFMGEADEPTGDMDNKTGAAKTKRVRKQVRHNVLFHSDEGGALNKMIERSGSTIGETLRSAWSGETIGAKNGRVETTRIVPAGSYSLGLVVGYQPTTILPLLDDYEAGTPQRWLYCWAIDPTIPPRGERVLWPGELPSPFPDNVPTDLPAPGSIIAAPAPGGVLDPITFDPAITDELYDTEHSKNTGSLPEGHPLRDPFRSQHPVLKVKVAVGLALLDSRRKVDLEDWRLAQIVIDTSDRVRQHLQALADAAREETRRGQLRNEGENEHVRAVARHEVAETAEQRAVMRAARRIAGQVHDLGPDKPQTLGALRRVASSADRKYVEPGVERAVELLWIAVADGKYVPGTALPQEVAS